MRQAFCQALLADAANPDFVFLTGDLGFKALEDLRDAMGSRFINAGVAEQNMVSVAAGLGRMGLRPWAYSIAPFIFARPFEQIRNDVCLPNLPVVLVGNGGGYGYGVMGSSHHALEDYGVLLTLPNLRAFVPAFDSDVRVVVSSLMHSAGPSYLRLGISEEPKEWPVPAYAPWRRLCRGLGPTVVVVGTLVGTLVERFFDSDPTLRPDLWVVSELPIYEIPAEFRASLTRSERLIVIEEHTLQGGFGQMLAHRLLTSGKAPLKFEHFHSQGYVSGLYGSQRFHRRNAAWIQTIFGKRFRQHEPAESVGRCCDSSTPFYIEAPGKATSRPNPRPWRQRLHRSESGAHASGTSGRRFRNRHSPSGLET